MVDALFSTITNVNFDKASIRARVERAFALRDKLKQQVAEAGLPPYDAEEVVWAPVVDEYEEKGFVEGVLRETNADVRSLKELVIYGLKGMAVYAEHTMVIFDSVSPAATTA